MRVEVEGPARYKDVSVEHPTIVLTIQNLAKQGKNLEYIMRIVGMPSEVVQRHMRTAQKT